MASKPPLPSPDAASEGSQIEELPDGVYRKDLTEDQLSGFYAAAYTDHQQMIDFLADVMGLRNIAYKALNAIIVDYFSGFLLFAKEAGLSIPTTFHVWKLSHDVLDHIKEGASFEEAERLFKKLLLKLTIIQRKGDVPQLTDLECQKIIPFFTTTVFQHYTLLSHCFNHDHTYWFENEQVWVQTPLVYPHNMSSTRDELDREKAAWEAYEIAEVVHSFLDHFTFWAIEDIMKQQVPGDVDIRGLSPDDYVKAAPESLDQCIERACRHRIEEATKLVQVHYQKREEKLLLKLTELEVKSGLHHPSCRP